MSDNSNQIPLNENENSFDQSSQFMPNYAEESDNQMRFESIHRPRLNYSRMPYSAFNASTVSNSNCSAAETAPSNSFMTTFTSGLQLLQNINSIQTQLNQPIVNQSVAQSAAQRVVS